MEVEQTPQQTLEKTWFDALKFGRVETIKIILNRGIDINAQDSGGNTALHLAVVKKNMELVDFLLNSGINPNIKNHIGVTAVYFVITKYFGEIACKIVRRFIEAGADINCPTDRGWTVLHVAAARGDGELVKVLISLGANVEAKDLDNQVTPLHAVAESSKSAAAFEALLSANADINAKGGWGQTPLHSLAMNSDNFIAEILGMWITYGISDAKTNLDLFLKYKADIYAKDDNGRTPMDDAIATGNFELVKALVHCGVDVNSKWTPYDMEFRDDSILHGAVIECDLATVKFLLKNGANLNTLNSDNVSPLQDAVDAVCYNSDNPDDESIKVLQYLLKRNPDVNVITADGLNILTCCDPSQETPEILWKSILQHLAKLFGMGQTFHPTLFNTILLNSKYLFYFSTCLKELENLKAAKVNSGWVSLFHLLVHDKKRLVNYAGHEDFVEFYKTSNVAQTFPIYGATVEKKFEKAIKKKVIWDKVADILSSSLPKINDPKHPVIQQIIRVSDPDDLWKNCESLIN